MWRSKTWPRFVLTKPISCLITEGSHEGPIRIRLEQRSRHQFLESAATEPPRFLPSRSLRRRRILPAANTSDGDGGEGGRQPHWYGEELHIHPAGRRPEPLGHVRSQGRL